MVHQVRCQVVCPRPISPIYSAHRRLRRNFYNDLNLTAGYTYITYGIHVYPPAHVKTPRISATCRRSIRMHFYYTFAQRQQSSPSSVNTISSIMLQSPMYYANTIQQKSWSLRVYCMKNIEWYFPFCYHICPYCIHTNRYRNIFLNFFSYIWAYETYTRRMYSMWEYTV